MHPAANRESAALPGIAPAGALGAGGLRDLFGKRLHAWAKRVLGYDPGMMHERADEGRNGMNDSNLAVAPQGLSDLHPNEFDCHRIERALESRQRYRYVQIAVIPIANGYRIESPCCSRNVEPSGGIIDIARIEHQPAQDGWILFRKNHWDQTWLIHGAFASLQAVLDLLKQDPAREFWP
jgi:hypothetical protein